MGSYITEVKEGRLNKSASLNIADELKAYEGCEIKITIEKVEDSRTNQQNKYWWAMVTILSKETGYTKDEMHDILKVKFLKRSKFENEQLVEYCESSANLTKTEFKEMTSDLIRWSAQELNIVLPIP